jgi:dihydroorotate dehydrogenase electron transfer subunit
MAVATLPSWLQVRGRVVRQRPSSAGHFWLEIDLPVEFHRPEPGQFVQLMLEVPSPVFLPRPMSVAGVVTGARGRRLAFLYQPIGAGTQALAALAPGAHVEVLGPLGRGFPLERPGMPLLVAGGRGVAPLLFAAERLADRGRSFTFLFGARDRAHLVELAETRRRLARAGGRLHTATDDGSAGLHGNVIQLLERIEPTVPRPLVIHACGPHAMLAAVARWAMAREALAFVAMESVMACGTGVCRGCPLPRSEAGRRRYRREHGNVPSLLGNRDFAMTCTEGPVFEARELDWEHVG